MRKRTRRELAQFLTEHGYPIRINTLNRLCQPSVGQGPPPCGKWGSRDLYDDAMALARRAFDYGSLPAGEAKRLRQHTEKIRGQMQATVPIIIEIGRELIAIKETLDHGRFITWVEAEIGITRRTAQNYMNAARFAEGKSEMVSLLNPAVLYRLSSKTTPPAIV